jgi:multimeric flavodoxin WrbA
MRDTYTVRQTAQLKLFADLAAEPWQQGKLVDKGATAFTSSQTEHGKSRPSTGRTRRQSSSHARRVLVSPASPG